MKLDPNYQTRQAQVYNRFLNDNNLNKGGEPRRIFLQHWNEIKATMHREKDMPIDSQSHKINGKKLIFNDSLFRSAIGFKKTGNSETKIVFNLDSLEHDVNAIKEHLFSDKINSKVFDKLDEIKRFIETLLHGHRAGLVSSEQIHKVYIDQSIVPILNKKGKDFKEIRKSFDQNASKLEDHVDENYKEEEKLQKAKRKIKLSLDSLEAAIEKGNTSSVRVYKKELADQLKEQFDLFAKRMDQKLESQIHIAQTIVKTEPNAEIDDLKRQLEECRVSNDKNKSQIKQFIADLNEKDASIAQLKELGSSTDIADIAKKLIDSQAETAAQKTALEKLKTNLEADIAKCQAGRIEDAEQVKKRLENLWKRAEEGENDANTKFVALGIKMTDLEGVCKKKIQDLETNAISAAETAQMQLNSLKTQLAECKKGSVEQSELNSQIKSLQSKLSEYKSETSQLKADIQQVRKEKSIIQKDLDSNKNLLNQANANLTQLQEKGVVDKTTQASDLSALNIEKERLQATISQQKEKVITAQKEVSSLQAQLRASQNGSNATESQLKDQLEQKSQELVLIKSEYNDSKTAEVKIREALEIAKSDKKQLLNQIVELQKQIKQNETDLFLKNEQFLNLKSEFELKEISMKNQLEAERAELISQGNLAGTKYGQLIEAQKNEEIKSLNNIHQALVDKYNDLSVQFEQFQARGLSVEGVNKSLEENDKQSRAELGKCRSELEKAKITFYQMENKYALEKRDYAVNYDALQAGNSYLNQSLQALFQMYMQLMKSYNDNDKAQNERILNQIQVAQKKLENYSSSLSAHVISQAAARSYDMVNDQISNQLRIEDDIQNLGSNSTVQDVTEIRQIANELVNANQQLISNEENPGQAMLQQEAPSDMDDMKSQDFNMLDADQTMQVDPQTRQSNDKICLQDDSLEMLQGKTFVVTGKDNFNLTKDKLVKRITASKVGMKQAASEKNADFIITATPDTITATQHKNNQNAVVLILLQANPSILLKKKN